MGHRRLIVGVILALLPVFSVTLVSSAAAQRRPARPQPTEVAGRSATPPAAIQVPSAPAATDGVPTEATLGVPVYPTAVYLTSYDAGRGQRYYIFGTDSTFEEMVRYYAVVLDEGGDEVFTAPAVHVFETGRFREESMAFPPSVTIKDYTWNGSEGYLNPASDADDRYRTVIQIVPPPVGQPAR